MLNEWANKFADLEPLAHKAKARFPERWVRFHSLPESKRYPDCERDFETLLRRFNTVIGELACEQEQVVLLTTEFSESDRPTTVPSLTPSSLPWRTVVVDDFFWHIYATGIPWKRTVFDPLVRTVAVDAALNVMICHARCDWLLHPYDGGMDVILPTTAARDDLKAKFVDWLSARSDGR